MKFEYCSRYRNRNLFPSCGQFVVECAQGSNTKTTAVDPVCLAAPMISWTSGFNSTCVVSNFSAIDDQTTELILTFTSLPLQCTIVDFLCGCVLTCSNPVLNLRINSSEAISPLIIRAIVAPNVTVPIGTTLNITDYSTFSPLNIRAPLKYDVGAYKYLFNESNNQYLSILNVDLITRRLAVKEQSAPGWSSTDQLNIRDALPTFIGTISSSTVNTITTSLTLNTTFIGDWIRMRLPDYSNANPADSWSRQIVNVNGNTVTIYPPLPSAPTPGNTIEILSFSYDNSHPVQMYESAILRPYLVSLEMIAIPNVPVYGGNLKDIPYLYIEVNDSNATVSQRNLINSNNPLIPEAVWLMTLDPYSTNQKTLKFTHSKSLYIPQKMWINVQEPLIITIRLPNGKIFQPIYPDTTNPQASWYDLNLSALFDFQTAPHD